MSIVLANDFVQEGSHIFQTNISTENNAHQRGSTIDNRLDGLITTNSLDVILSLVTTTATTAVPSLVHPTSITKNRSESWCIDLQGSDFIYTPTLYSSTVRHVIAAAFIALMIITILGNAVVIIIVFMDRPLRRITSGLVVSMAAADILVAMCGELQSVITMLSEDEWEVSDTLCEVFASADLYFSLSGLLHIACLAGDRYLAICYPFKYERYGHRYLVASIAISWTLPVAFSFLPILVHWHRLGLEELYACLHDLEVHICTIFPNRGFSTISFILMFLLPSAFMCYCYIHIFRAAKYQRKRMSSLTLGAYSDTDDTMYELKRLTAANGTTTSSRRPSSARVFISNHSSSAQSIPRIPSSPSYSSSRVFHPASSAVPAQEPSLSDQASPTEDTTFIQISETRPAPVGNGVSLSNGTKRDRRESADERRKGYRPFRKRRSRTLSGHLLGFLGEDFRAARSISIVFVCFTVTWTPYWLTILIMPYLGPNEIPDPLIGACLWLAYFGSALNPFVYYFSNTAVKKGITRRMHKILRRFRPHHIDGASPPSLSNC